MALEFLSMFLPLSFIYFLVPIFVLFWVWEWFKINAGLQSHFNILTLIIKYVHISLTSPFDGEHFLLFKEGCLHRKQKYLSNFS